MAPALTREAPHPPCSALLPCLTEHTPEEEGLAHPQNSGCPNREPSDVEGDTAKHTARKPIPGEID